MSETQALYGGSDWRIDFQAHQLFSSRAQHLALTGCQYIRGPSPGSRREAPFGARGTSLFIGSHSPRARRSESPGFLRAVCTVGFSPAHLPHEHMLHALHERSHF